MLAGIPHLLGTPVTRDLLVSLESKMFREIPEPCSALAGSATGTEPGPLFLQQDSVLYE